VATFVVRDGCFPLMKYNSVRTFQPNLLKVIEGREEV